MECPPGSVDGHNLPDQDCIQPFHPAEVGKPVLQARAGTYIGVRLIKVANTLQSSWELFRCAKSLLRQSTELYLLERLCAQIASGDMVSQAPFDRTRATANTLVLVDLKDDVDTFLGRFQVACLGRGKLTGNAQLACFFALLVFGVAKSILIDTYSIRVEYEDPNPWSKEHAMKMTSGYKVLVSLFCWASKADVTLQDVAGIENEELRSRLYDTQDMVHRDTWEGLKIKSTKDFLLGLGGSLLPDGSYNGFFPQKLGFSDLSKMRL